MKRLTTQRITEMEKKMFLNVGNKVYTETSTMEVTYFNGDKVKLENRNGESVIANINLVNVLPPYKEFKDFVSNFVLIRKYKSEGIINPDLSIEDSVILNNYIDSYINMKEDSEMFFNGNQYIAINPLTLSHAEYDPETETYMVVNLGDYFETKSLELAMKPSFEFHN